MPPRIPGTLSNGVMSLKFMQRALVAEQKPVQPEAAEILDDSKWVIARSPEEDALHTTSSSKWVLLRHAINRLQLMISAEASK